MKEFNDQSEDQSGDADGIDPKEQKRREVLFRLAASLLEKRDEAVKFRAASGIEQQWREDEKVFAGIDGTAPGDTSMMAYALGMGATKEDGPKRSKVLVNIIRGKCEIAEGRFSEIMLPTDDKNYGLKVTPNPMITEALKDGRQASQQGKPLAKEDGSPITMAEVAKSDSDIAKERMKKMETVIDDQLTECSYNGESRKVIRGSVRIGTGIIKGPNVVKATKKRWQDQGGVYTLSVEEDQTPASKEVSCWNVYPDPDVGEDIRRASYIWERDSILPRELRDLADVDGYFQDQVIEILKEDPIRTIVGYQSKENKHRIQQTTLDKGSLFEKWEYYGDLNRDDLEVLGVDISHDEITQSFSACVVFVNDKPIKVMLNVLDTGDHPYDFFPWATVSGSPWGIGIPRILFWLQRIVTSAWRAMMDNAGDSAGANIVLSNRMVPDDGVWEITGKKIWRLLDDDDVAAEDVRKAFAQFQIQNNQASLQAIIDLALKFVDMETAMPMLFQGEKSTAPETLGATNIMVDSSNIALRSRVKLYDDQITRPHLTRYYDWNMQYHPDPEIKGDYNVDPRGTSVLFEKDQQAQTLMQVMSMKGDPDFAVKIDWEKAVDQVLSSLRLDIAKSPEDFEAAKKKMSEQQGPQDPALMAAEIRVKGDIEKAKMTLEANREERQAKEVEAEKDRQHQFAMKEMDQNIKMMEFANNNKISLEQIKAKLTGEAAKLQTQVAMAGPDKKGPQISVPLVEPEGRAPEGMAYQA